MNYGITLTGVSLRARRRIFCCVLPSPRTLQHASAYTVHCTTPGKLHVISGESWCAVCYSKICTTVLDSNYFSEIRQSPVGKLGVVLHTVTGWDVLMSTRLWLL